MNANEPHKHRDIIIAWANGETIQVRRKYGNWNEVKHPNFNPDYDCEFRVKPKTININGHEVPEPIRAKLPIGTRFYIPNVSAYGSQFESICWDGDSFDLKHLQLGLVHLEEIDAIQHAKALLSFTSK